MNLVVGHVYEVTDPHKQTTFMARFMGQARDANGLDSARLFVVEREDKHTVSWTLAGCELRCHVDQAGGVHPYLYATHYGNQLDELEKIGGPRYISPHWILE